MYQGPPSTKIFGNPDLNDIETTDVENFNGICRERDGRIVRKTKCFSKYKRRLECAIHLFQFYWNFINEFKGDTSPAISEELTDHIWSWHEFLMYHFAYNFFKTKTFSPYFLTF